MTERYPLVSSALAHTWIKAKMKIKKKIINRLLKHIIFNIFARVLTRFSHKAERNKNKAFQFEDVVLYFED